MSTIFHLKPYPLIATHGISDVNQNDDAYTYKTNLKHIKIFIERKYNKNQNVSRENKNVESKNQIL